MLHRTTHREDFDFESIDEYIRMAISAPDEVLLQAHFDACARHSSSGSAQLTEPQLEWVVSNLDSNPKWQQSWKRRENELGRPISWRRSARFSLRRSITFEVHQRWRYASGAARLAAALLSGVILYSVLWSGGYALLPETYTWASLDGYDALLDSEARNVGSNTESSFSQAAAALLAAHHTTIGLFPRYDRSEVRRAVRHLDVAYSVTTDPFQRAEIAYFQAKAFLMLDDVLNAKQWLERGLVEGVADYRVESERLLQAITIQSTEGQEPTSTNGAQ